jgi:hypothetical protein
MIFGKDSLHLRYWRLARFIERRAEELAVLVLKRLPCFFKPLKDSEIIILPRLYVVGARYTDDIDRIIPVLSENSIR